METKFIIGNFYKINEIEENGFYNTKETNAAMFYRNGKSLMIFDIPKPLSPRLYKLISICED